ncbi:hypothetical protein FHK92_07550 [Pseudomonas brassicacearum subsp. neoaurantiaca]|uniref:Uncharacterized protein n=1 Tax=Pseudomonas brassicacearum subsp. neoaurantiaca TaxID=494916 RepID=A0A7V8RJG6_9PSED|nr:hypothetical protein [Pseudomonas brassicacearum subsp. neoaurantiaca]
MGPQWRGSLLLLGCTAAPRCIHHHSVPDRTPGPASQSSGSKLPRHRVHIANKKIAVPGCFN